MDVGRVALKRGPLVYCVEEADNPAGRSQRLRLPRDGEARDAAAAATSSTGSSTVVAEGAGGEHGDWDGRLYRTEPPTEAAGDADGGALLSLEQSRAGPDAGLDTGGLARTSGMR